MEFSEIDGKRPLGRPRMRRDDSIYVYMRQHICIYAVMYVYMLSYMYICCHVCIYAVMYVYILSYMYICCHAVNFTFY